MLPNSSIAVGQLSGSDAVNALHQSVVTFNETTAKQTATLVRLTRALTGLTVAILLVMGVQICIAIQSMP